MSDYCPKCKTHLGTKTLAEHSDECTSMTFADKLVLVIDAMNKNKKPETNTDTTVKPDGSIPL